MTRERCPWAKSDLEIAYHDNEWGKPERSDAKLFEMLILEGMQAGLSWSFILKRRENMRAAFDGFDPEKIARYDAAKEAGLLANPNILRNRAKIAALAKNARAFLAAQKEFGSFAKYLWGFVDNKPIVNHWEDFAGLPASTDISTAMSRDLKKRGFKFVGPTICYAYMQAVGLVNDHLITCPEHEACLE